MHYYRISTKASQQDGDGVGWTLVDDDDTSQETGEYAGS